MNGSRNTAPPDLTREVLPVPLSERILDSLPGRRTPKVLIWGSLGPIRPFVAAGLLMLMGNEALALDVLDRNIGIQWVFGYITVVALLSTRSLRRDLQAVLDAIESPDERGAASAYAKPIGWSLPPILVALVLTGVAVLGRSGLFPLAVDIIDAAILFLILVPVGTWVWTYAVALWRLDEIGHALIDESAFPGDRTLGTRPLGALAFRGFVAFSAAVLPFLLIVAVTAVDVAEGLAVFFLALAVFVISLWRVRGRLGDARSRHVARARDLYDAAIKPLRDNPSVEELARRAPTISAASELLNRASGLAEWPIDEALPARLFVVVTGVVTAVISAFVLRTIGFG